MNEGKRIMRFPLLMVLQPFSIMVTTSRTVYINGQKKKNKKLLMSTILQCDRRNKVHSFVFQCLFCALFRGTRYASSRIRPPRSPETTLRLRGALSAWPQRQGSYQDNAAYAPRERTPCPTQHHTDFLIKRVCF